MNVATLFLIMFVGVCAVMGLFLIAATANTTPVDTSGNTVNEQTNLSVTNASAIMKTGTSVTPWIVMIIAVLIICGVFFWAYGHSHGGYKSRYA